VGDEDEGLAALLELADLLEALLLFSPAAGLRGFSSRKESAN
jgi:hypothetical protein